MGMSKPMLNGETDQQALAYRDSWLASPFERNGGGITVKNVDKKVVRIPVPANYVTNGKKEKESGEYYECWLIAGVKKEDVAILTVGERKIPVFFIDVPADQAKELVSFTWAEFNFDKAKRRRIAAGCLDLRLDEMEVDMVDANAEDPLQHILDREALCLIDDIIKYLESINPIFGTIFKELLDGNFNKSEISRKIHKPDATGRRWVDKVISLAREFYEERNKF